MPDTHPGHTTCVRCIALSTQLGTQNHTHTARHMELGKQQPVCSTVNTKSDTQGPVPNASALYEHGKSGTQNQDA